MRGRRRVQAATGSRGGAALALLCCAGLLAVAGCSVNSPGVGPGEQSQPSASRTQPVSLSMTPGRQASHPAPGEPVTVTAEHGTITEVTLVGKDGTVVSGTLGPQATSWRATQELGFGKTYTLRATGTNEAGRSATVSSTFTTATPASTAGVVVNVADGQTVGVGMPLVFDFTQPIPDREAAEQALTVDSEPDTVGAFHWFRDDYAVWRPKEHWQPGTTITVNAEIYGQDLGDGVFGAQDKSFQLTVGDKVVVTADGQSHTMTVDVNGSTVKSYEISMGDAQHPTPRGVYTVMADRTDYVMSSATYGVPVDAPQGYKVTVDYATRLSQGGIFFHSAPWSVWAQGERNVSHGCINMRSAAASWLMNHTKPGDLFKVINSGGPPLQPANGWGFWQMSWDEWTAQT